MYISFALGSQCEPHFQWNIGGGGPPTQRFCVGHVHFMLFVSILFESGPQRKPVFQWNMGLRDWSLIMGGGGGGGLQNGDGGGRQVKFNPYKNGRGGGGSEKV